MKIVRFIGELTKFGMYPRADALQCFKQLLLNFAHHYIEMTCHLLETCGRFLLHHPDSHQRTKVYLVNRKITFVHVLFGKPKVWFKIGPNDAKKIDAGIGLALHHDG